MKRKIIVTVEAICFDCYRIAKIDGAPSVLILRKGGYILARINDEISEPEATDLANRIHLVAIQKKS